MKPPNHGCRVRVTLIDGFGTNIEEAIGFLSLDPRNPKPEPDGPLLFWRPLVLIGANVRPDFLRSDDRIEVVR